MLPHQSAAAAGNSNQISQIKYGCKHLHNQSQLIQVQLSEAKTLEIADFEPSVIFFTVAIYKPHLHARPSLDA